MVPSVYVYVCQLVSTLTADVTMADITRRHSAMSQCSDLLPGITGGEIEALLSFVTFSCTCNVPMRMTLRDAHV